MNIPATTPSTPTVLKEYYAYFVFNTGAHGNYPLGEFRDDRRGRAQAIDVANDTLRETDNNIKRFTAVSTDPNFEPLDA